MTVLKFRWTWWWHRAFHWTCQGKRHDRVTGEWVGVWRDCTCRRGGDR